MKKLMYAITVAVALVLSISTPLTAVRASAFSGGLGGRSISEFSMMLDISTQSGSNEKSQYFKSYAFAEQGKTALKWKDIKLSELTLGLQWDVSKIAKKPGKLILSSAAASDTKAASVSDCETAATDGVVYSIYAITGVASSPATISKDKIVYTSSGAFVDIGTGNEWSKDGYIWRSADGDGPNGRDTTEKWCSVALSTEKQTIYVRGKAITNDASNITLASVKSVKVSVAAMPKAPKVNIYLSRGILSTRAGMEISNDGKTWGKMTETTLNLGTATDLPASAGSGTVKIDLGNNQDVYVRTPAGNGKPPSDTFETRLKFKDAGVVSAEYFVAAPNVKIKVDNSIAVEAFVDGKWKKVKEIDATSIPANGLRVRRTAKDRLPGPEGILKVVSYGEYREVSISSV